MAKFGNLKNIIEKDTNGETTTQTTTVVSPSENIAVKETVSENTATGEQTKQVSITTIQEAESVQQVAVNEPKAKKGRGVAEVISDAQKKYSEAISNNKKQNIGIDEKLHFELTRLVALLKANNSTKITIQDLTSVILKDFLVKYQGDIEELKKNF